MIPFLDDVAERYELAASVSVGRLCVEDDGAEGLAHAVRSLLRQLGHNADDEYWKRVVARLRRTWWELATVPLPHDHQALDLRGTSVLLERWLRDCDRVYPSHGSAAADITRRIADLSRAHDDPLGKAVCSLDRDCEWWPPRRALLLRDVRYADEVATHLSQVGVRLDVLVPGQLTRASTYDRMIAVGSSAWFPNHVFSAPLANRIDLVQFAWIRDQALETGILPATSGAAAPRRLLDAHDSRSRQAVEAGELVPVTNWAMIATRTGARSSPSDSRADTVDAYLLLLASGDAVYLEAEQGSRAYVLDVSSGSELHQIPTSSIQPGAYLVTRVGGEGDYIPAIANALLGADAARLRASQRRWKERLRSLIAAVGLRGVAIQVRSAGAPRANEPNIRRWAAADSIRTNDFADFNGLMKTLGLGDEAQQLWQDMDLIDQAHLRAGQRARALLNREIAKSDSAELERRGWRDFDVAEIEGEGALRVARVIARAPATVLVPARETRELRAVERDLWPE